MFKPEQIPEDVWVQVALRLESCGAVVSDDVAKLVAAEVINAWPQMQLSCLTVEVPGRKIILPLPTEKTYDR